MTTKTLPQSAHFTYHELAEGVWAAIVISTGLAASNSGIVDLGDHTLIFDTTLSPASAADLRNAAENLTGRSVSHVFNSHFHNDHVFGNAIFHSTTEIYATARTREIMAEKTETSIVEFKNYWPEATGRSGLKAQKSQKMKPSDLDYQDSVRFAQSIIDTFPQLELRLPDHTFTDDWNSKGPNAPSSLSPLAAGIPTVTHSCICPRTDYLYR